MKESGLLFCFHYKYPVSSIDESYTHAIQLIAMNLHFLHALSLWFVSFHFPEYSRVFFKYLYNILKLVLSLWLLPLYSQ